MLSLFSAVYMPCFNITKSILLCYNKNGQPIDDRPPSLLAGYAHIFRNDVITALAAFAAGFMET